MVLTQVLNKILDNKNQINLPPKNTNVYIGLSGGVDSTASAIVLKELGYDVRGVFLICWDPKAPGCTADQDKADAIKTASMLNISLEIVDYQKEYKEKVFNYMIEEYQSFRIPNPDILCNSKIKFGCLYEKLSQTGEKFHLSTGHYARNVNQKYLSEKGYSLPDDYYIGRAFDEGKDQSYFLYDIEKSRLKNITFPLGVLKKEEVRNVVKAYGVPNWDKPDSQGICFIGDISLGKLMKEYTKDLPGNIIDINGKVIGKHKGLSLYTIGQRHGLDVDKTETVPVYVIKKDIENNELMLGHREEVYVKSFLARLKCGLEIPNGRGGFKVRIRNLGDLFDCKVEDQGNDLYRIITSESVFAVNPGQHAVFYLNDLVIGGGIIE